MSYKEFLRNLCPKYLPFRRLLAKVKLLQYSRYLIPETEVSAAEKDIAYKKVLVKKYSKKWSKYVAEIEKKIDELLMKSPKCQSRSDKEFLKLDMAFCRLAYGFQPNEYLSFGLETRDEIERRSFVSDLDRWKYVYRMNDMVDYMVLGDKWDTYKKYYSYFQRDAISISSKNDYEKFASFTKKHPIFVKKEVLSSRGIGVELIDVKNDNLSQEELFKRLLKEGKTILEERLIQSDEMALLNASSLNTVRCATLYTNSGIDIAFCFLRVGRAGAFVDNGSAGGIEVGIDLETGRLNTDGFDQYGMRFQKHPDSKVQFSGYQLPQWNSMLSICIEMAQKLPSVKYICWDMSHTPNGWVVVEGNNAGQMMGPQIVYQRGIKTRIESFIIDMDLLA